MLSLILKPETTGKMLVNQMLSGYGMLFATQVTLCKLHFSIYLFWFEVGLLVVEVIFQDRSGKLSLLGMIEQCLKVGKKQAWHAASVTNACVGLLAGLKVFMIIK